MWDIVKCVDKNAAGRPQGIFAIFVPSNLICKQAHSPSTVRSKAPHDPRSSRTVRCAAPHITPFTRAPSLAPSHTLSPQLSSPPPLRRRPWWRPLSPPQTELDSRPMAALQALLPNQFALAIANVSSASPSSLSVKRSATIACCVPAPSLPASVATAVNGSVAERSEVRIGLPSKGRMASETLDLLKDCQLSVRQVNPRQYVAQIPQISNLEVWFQRPKDIVRKLLTGDLDLGIVGLDTVSEYGQGSPDLIIVHDELEYGDCRLSLAIPKYGIFENVNSISQLVQMPQWTSEKPLRVATGFTYLGPKFMKENGLEHVSFSTADGALEAAPAMGTADAILDLVSSGTTLRENNLKEIEGGVVLESQAVLVASKGAVIERSPVLTTTREILERLEAHLRAVGQFTVTANMKGRSAEEVAERILSQPSLSGLQGPTVSPVFCKLDGKVIADYYAIVICVPKKDLYLSVQQLRAIGGSGVLVSPLTYIFDAEPPRWQDFLVRLGL